ncbi:hypothetical protein M413DRAFT_59067 [Hebeloma cylindrosporum]|uniref:RING-type domain-containing protein n=1 Tax=Hebeloma cylindrosporum TaxID=76867 RepID=A0A0C3CKL7_HEBCY|nr:hypothetical protein M413DRAFT_59067 [Hebeloma cylindrosporum h7]
MSTTRLHPHHSLPAPVVHATFSVSQSKSHVLAGVQDAYWSDDEAEDAECPLCLEEMDISDLNFKPCICGYQICRFCWHHIKENLNKRCPACRRVYTDDAIEFKPIATQDHKRLTQQKKQRDRERKDLEALGRKHLANVRVVQRNVVYVVGIGPRFAKEELIPTLRSNEYFGQYGKITKILLVKRNSPGGGVPVVGLYITYHRREDAARAIAAVDGTQSPGGGRDIMRASYGTTKYCMAFLRGVSCTGLPRAASWAQKGSTIVPSSVGSNPNMISSTMFVPPRQPRRTGPVRLSRNVATTGSSSTNDSRPGTTKSVERKLISLSSSRPSTPVEASRVDGNGESKTTKMKESVVPSLSNSPAPSITTSDQGSAVQEMPPSLPIRPDSTDSSQSNHGPRSTKLPNVPLVPPGLAVPPGISSPSRPPRAETASPQTPLLASHSSYQMSTAARALLDDVKARRESALPISSGLSPFPDFDRTLQTLSGEDGGGFSFNLDPKLADEADSAENLPDFDMTSTIPFRGSYLDAFPALRSGTPYTHPPLGYPQTVAHPIYDPSAARPASGSLLEKQAVRGASYLGSFNPFSEPSADSVTSSPSPSLRSSYSPIDEERKVSRFGFARGRQSSTATSSSLHSIPPLNYSNDLQPLYHSPDEPVHPWPPGLHDIHVSSPLSGSPLPHSATAQPMFVPHQGHLQSLSSGDLSEAQLRNFIQSSQERENGIAHARRTLDSQQLQFRASQTFEDPAIMLASFAAPASMDLEFPSYGPPPGLPVPSPGLPPVQQHGGISERRNNSTQGESFVSCLEGREATVPSTVLSQCGTSTIDNDSSRKFFSPSSARESAAFHYRT